MSLSDYINIKHESELTYEYETISTIALTIESTIDSTIDSTMHLLQFIAFITDVLSTFSFIIYVICVIHVI